MNKPGLFVIGIIIIVVIAYTMAKTLHAPEQLSSDKITIVTTLFPLYDFAKKIGGDRAMTTLLLPPGVEAHSFEPKPADIATINSADVFIYTSPTMEPWASDIIKSVSKPLIIDASNGINVIDNDPHYWTDFDNAQIMVNTIAEALARADESNRQYYLDNAKTLNSQLSTLDSDYSEKLSSCDSKEIVFGGHYALGYLTRKYNLNYTAAQGLAPDAEPTIQDLAKLVEQVKQNNIKTIYYEELTSPKIAETLASETDAKLLPLSAAHNLSKDELETGTTFIDIMRGNLANLKTGMACH